MKETIPTVQMLKKKEKKKKKERKKKNKRELNRLAAQYLLEFQMPSQI